MKEEALNDLIETVHNQSQLLLNDSFKNTNVWGLYKRWPHVQLVLLLCTPNKRIKLPCGPKKGKKSCKNAKIIHSL